MRLTIAPNRADPMTGVQTGPELLDILCHSLKRAGLAVLSVLSISLGFSRPLSADVIFKADFTWAPSSPTPGNPVTFTDTSSSLASSWSWDFGDGAKLDCATQACRNPTHKYATAGVYTVTLTIVQRGPISATQDTATKGVPVSAPGQKPAAEFTFQPTSPEPGQLISFNDASTGSPTSWAWDFGDGVTSPVQNPKHAFAAAKSYLVSLTVTSALGSSSTSRMLAVTAPPRETASEFSVPSVSVQFNAVTPGPDGNLWATARFENVETAGIQISTVDGSTTVYTLPLAKAPGAIAAGPDGSLWFTEPGGNTIGRITLSGVVTEFPTPIQFSEPIGITPGPDGNLWFTEYAAHSIGRITLAGVIADFPVPTPSSGPFGITADQDGNLWFTEQAGNGIGRITASGTVTAEFHIPTPSSKPSGITLGPDGNLWFTEQDGNKIGRIDPAKADSACVADSSKCIAEFPILTPGVSPLGITAGADGNLWFTAGNDIGRITTAGSIVEFPAPSGTSPVAVALGIDGNVWYVTRNAVGGPSSHDIGRVTPAGTVTAFSGPGDTVSPFSIAAGPDASLWFVEFSGNKIAKIDLSGTVIDFAVPTPSSQPAGIALGSDGNLWFTEFNQNKIGRITPFGMITEFRIGTQSSFPDLIVAGSDKNLWFAEANGNKIGRIDPAKADDACVADHTKCIAEFPIPTAQSDPTGIALGPDENVWFTEQNGSKIGRITPSGAITEFRIPTPSSQPLEITGGPDGNLWFTEGEGNQIGRIDPAKADNACVADSAKCITEFPVPTPSSAPGAITAGPEGNLWFTEANKIGRITPSGTITEFPISTPNPVPGGVATGPDGNIWFTETGANKIGRVDISSLERARVTQPQHRNEGTHTVEPRR